MAHYAFTALSCFIFRIHIHYITQKDLLANAYVTSQGSYSKLFPVPQIRIFKLYLLLMVGLVFIHAYSHFPYEKFPSILLTMSTSTQDLDNGGSIMHFVNMSLVRTHSTEYVFS